MKKIQYFKLFESRTAELSEEEFLNLVKNKCRDFIKSPKYLQRIKNDFNGEYSYINPKLSHRNPLMKEDGGGVFSSHHTLLMDNLPSWSKFPKRSKSIIGSTNFGFDPSFGDHYYMIIPYDGAIFGVAPSSDLWSSTCRIPDSINSTSYRFDDVFSESFTQAGIPDNSYDDMMNDIQLLYDEYLSGKEHQISKYILNILKDMQSNKVKDVRTAFNEYFSPDKFSSLSPYKPNTFVTMNYSEISEITEIDVNGRMSKVANEFWTDSECLIVYLGDDITLELITGKYKEILELFS